MKFIYCLFIITSLFGDNNMKNKIITTETGLMYEDLIIGTGKSPLKGDKVVVHYTGKLEDGSIFDSSVDRNEPFKFPLGMGRVIKGWDEGISSMNIGGKRILTIPSHLAYGERGAGDRIPLMQL